MTAKRTTKNESVTVDVYNIAGAIVEKATLPEDIFGVSVSEGLLHEAVVHQRAKSRPMVASTKTRGEVRGGGRKPWKQKGTGRARHGSIRSPIWRGGGIVFGPRVDRNYETKMNKKARRKALCMALSQKVNDHALILVDHLSMEAPKTKTAASILKAFPQFDRRKKHTVGLISPKGSLALNKSFRNLEKVTIIPTHKLNIIDVLTCKFLLMPVQSIGEIQTIFSKKEKAEKAS